MKSNLSKNGVFSICRVNLSCSETETFEVALPLKRAARQYNMLANSNKQPVQLGKTKQKLLRVEGSVVRIASMGVGEMKVQDIKKCNKKRKNSQIEIILLPFWKRLCPSHVH